MIKTSAMFIASLFTCTVYASSLCNEKEKSIFSFQIQSSKKIVSICEGIELPYLVYKFGTPDKVEMQYPPYLDDTSWNYFKFFGQRRSGGRENTGFGSYSLSFINSDTEYLVFQEWSDEEKTYSIGVNVQTPTKSRTFHGNRKTQLGSLVLLESKSQRIRNLATD